MISLIRCDSKRSFDNARTSVNRRSTINFYMLVYKNNDVLRRLTDLVTELHKDMREVSKYGVCKASLCEMSLHINLNFIRPRHMNPITRHNFYKINTRRKRRRRNSRFIFGLPKLYREPTPFPS